MAYGITSEAQLIDIKTIQSGCRSFMEAVMIFWEAGQQVIAAGEQCGPKALSVDGASMKADIVEVGQEIGNLCKEYIDNANEVIEQAVRIYNAQIDELNEYNRRQAIEREKKKQQEAQRRKG